MRPLQDGQLPHGWIIPQGPRRLAHNSKKLYPKKPLDKKPIQNIFAL